MTYQLLLVYNPPVPTTTTPDLATAYSVSDRILILRLGKVVESGPARAVLDDPQHEYSRLLKSSVLSPEVPSNGAAFHA